MLGADPKCAALSKLIDNVAPVIERDENGRTRHSRPSGCKNLGVGD